MIIDCFKYLRSAKDEFGFEEPHIIINVIKNNLSIYMDFGLFSIIFGLSIDRIRGKEENEIN